MITQPNQSPLPEKAFFTRGEIAAALGVSVVTIANLEKSGVLTAVPHLAHRRYPAEQVHALLSPTKRAA